MRNHSLNVQDGLFDQTDIELSYRMFRNICLVRYFEAGVIDDMEKKRINIPVYLSSGQEAMAAAMATEINDFLIFTQHRAHDIFLTFGGSPAALRDELRGLPTGTSQGKAGSNCLQWFGNGIQMFGHHGLIGENVPQGVGAALGSGKNTLCVFGDGAAEEDYVLASLGFAATHKLPVLFVCVDNDLSILTETKVRRSWRITEVAKSFGLHAEEVADDPWAVLNCTRSAKMKLPAFLNVQVCRWFWHVGAGCDGPPAWNRFELVKREFSSRGKGPEIQKIEMDVKAEMEQLWGKELSLKQ